MVIEDEPGEEGGTSTAFFLYSIPQVSHNADRYEVKLRTAWRRPFLPLSLSLAFAAGIICDEQSERDGFTGVKDVP